MLISSNWPTENGLKLSLEMVESTIKAKQDLS
jgi:hypothetical protein